MGPERTKKDPVALSLRSPKVKSKTNTQTAATYIGKSPAITPQHQAHRVNLPRQLTPYIAPHLRHPPPPFLVLTGATTVWERIHVYNRHAQMTRF